MNKQLEKIEKLCKELTGMNVYASEDGERELSFRELATISKKDELFIEFWTFLTELRKDRSSAGAEDAVLAQRIQDEVREYREVVKEALKGVKRDDSRAMLPAQLEQEKEAKKAEKASKLEAQAQALKQAIKTWQAIKWKEAQEAMEDGGKVMLVFAETGEAFTIEDMSRKAIYFRESPKDKSQVRLEMGRDLKDRGDVLQFTTTREVCYLAIAN